ncbi:MAG TPA: hypothetical protein VFF52_01525 [Isosphaeraceae bacterium]|nr:hypothetical protein [Isosphaeraceae bacterium]
MFDFLGDIFDGHHADDLFGAPGHGMGGHGDDPGHTPGESPADGLRFGSSSHPDTAFYHHDPNEGGLPGIGHPPGHGSHPSGPRFGEWVKWPSGYQYERDPDGHYTGRWSS